MTKPLPATQAWRHLYLIASVALLIGVTLVLLDISVSTMVPEAAADPAARTAADWLTLLHRNPLYALRDLGLLNVFTSLLGIPLFLALYLLLRHTSETYATLALALFLFGSAIYVAHNPALPLLSLSESYATATEAEQIGLVAAGEALLARGEDFTLGSLIGFILPSLASLLMAGVMLWSDVFSRWTAYAGLLGFSLLLVFTVWVTFVPAALTAAMILAMPGGLLVVAWNVLLAHRLFQLSRLPKSPPQTSIQKSPLHSVGGKR